MPSHWSDFKNDSPEMCRNGEERLHGRLAYLATVRRDGSPRVAPVSSFTDGAAVWLYVGGQSPKRFDLINDGRYALHCAVEDGQGGAGEFHVTGVAERVTNEASRKHAEAAWPGDDPVESSYLLFELLIETALYTVYSDGTPIRRRWESAERD